MSRENHAVWWCRAAQGLALRDLETLTHAYWDLLYPEPNATTVERLNWYIHHLLPEELAYADQQRRAIRQHPCDTLALLVGHSPEPLLQTIGVFQIPFVKPQLCLLFVRML